MTTLTKIVSMLTSPAAKADVVLKAAVTRADVARIASISAYS